MARPGFPLFVALVVSMAGTLPMSVDAQAVHLVGRTTAPFEFDDVNPCNGQPVVITGVVNATIRVTLDGQSGNHFKYTLVPSDVRGTETATGVQYLAVGGEREHFNIDADFERQNDTFTNTFNLISVGGTDNLIAHLTFHLTVDANGFVTALFQSAQVDCRG